MCILFIAIDQHPNYPLIIAANRDEFYERPTENSDFWPDYPEILAGRDLESGGTWMGVTRTGHLAALTNYRDPHQLDPDLPSRGRLVSDYLISLDEDYAGVLADTGEDYNGFNLLFGHWRDLKVYNNTDGDMHNLTPGYYGLSNAYLNTPWPKVAIGTEIFRQYCETGDNIDADHFFELLSDGQRAETHELPDTGVGLEFEHMLSSIFIRSPNYGTRSSTVVLVDKQGSCDWTEWMYDSQGALKEKKCFSLDFD